LHLAKLTKLGSGQFYAIPVARAYIIDLDQSRNEIQIEKEPKRKTDVLANKSRDVEDLQLYSILPHICGISDNQAYTVALARTPAFLVGSFSPIAATCLEAAYSRRSDAAEEMTTTRHQKLAIRAALGAPDVRALYFVTSRPERR
jgi:hypothetical protein